MTPFEIMASKIWSMGLVVLAASGIALTVVVQGLLAVPIQGSLLLFMVATALQLFATTSMGIFLATIAGSMPQFGLLLMLALLPLQVLSCGLTRRESMPEIVQTIMLAAPNTHPRGDRRVREPGAQRLRERSGGVHCTTGAVSRG